MDKDDSSYDVKGGGRRGKGLSLGFVQKRTNLEMLGEYYTSSDIMSGNLLRLA